MAKKSTQSKVLMVLTSHGKLEKTEQPTGYWLSECTHPYWKFVEANCSVDICSIEGGMAPVAPASLNMEDRENQRFWKTDRVRRLTEQTLPLRSFDGRCFDAIFFVGGFGTMWDFPFSPAVDHVSRAVYEKGGVIGAVCHGPIALANIRLDDGTLLVEGKKVTGFCNDEEAKAGLHDQLPLHSEIPGVIGQNGRSCEDILTALKAKYSHAPAGSCFVVSDQRVVTGQNPQSAAATAMAVLAQLRSRSDRINSH